jgi:formylglycine-generating enzyme required for sulfatase activity
MKSVILAAVLTMSSTSVYANGLPEFESPVFANPTIQDSNNFALVNNGIFRMGKKNGCNSYSSTPEYEVKLTKNFYIQKTPVTQAQWYLIMGTAYSFNRPGESSKHPCPDESIYIKKIGKSICPNNPVDRINWGSAIDFVDRLNKIEGLDCSVNDKPATLESFEKARNTPGCYRLPTSAEWEYATRAGSTGDFSFGNDFNQLPDFAWIAPNSGGTSHPTGTKKPNAFGLYDVHGNIQQTVVDTDYPLFGDKLIDPVAWTNWTQNVVRGASYADGPCMATSYMKSVDYKNGKPGSLTGFRIVKSAQ